MAAVSAATRGVSPGFESHQVVFFSLHFFWLFGVNEKLLTPHISGFVTKYISCCMSATRVGKGPGLGLVPRGVRVRVRARARYCHLLIT